MKIIAKTANGFVKKGNEDCFCLGGKVYCGESQVSVTTDELTSFAVFDGVGGNNAGEIASQTAGERFVNSLPVGSEEDVLRLIESMNTAIINKSKESPLYNGMATTVAGLTFLQNDFLCYNMGDSRIYRYRSGILHRFSKDHTYYQQLIENGVTEADAETYRDSHIITKCLGVDLNWAKDVFINYVDYGVKEGDIFLLCSDGITDMITDDEMADIMDEESCLETIFNRIIKTVQTNGAKDNYTIIIIQR
ncbi:MAG: PP2C family protein-serine/threonine phosphatase [Candidatus Coproplasma sp.]